MDVQRDVAHLGDLPRFALIELPAENKARANALIHDDVDEIRQVAPVAKVLLSHRRAHEVVLQKYRQIEALGEYIYQRNVLPAVEVGRIEDDAAHGVQWPWRLRHDAQQKAVPLLRKQAADLGLDHAKHVLRALPALKGVLPEGLHAPVDAHQRHGHLIAYPHDGDDLRIAPIEAQHHRWTPAVGLHTLAFDDQALGKQFVDDGRQPAAREVRPARDFSPRSAALADDAQGGGKVGLLDGGGVAALNEPVSAAGGSDHARPFFPSLCPFHYTTFPCRAQSRRPSAFAGEFGNLFGQTARFGHFRKETVTFSVQYSGKIVFGKGRFWSKKLKRLSYIP